MYIQGPRDPQGRRSRHDIKVPRELRAEGPEDDQDRPPTTRQRQGFWQGRVRHVGVLSMGANGYVNRKFNYSSLNRRD